MRRGGGGTRPTDVPTTRSRPSDARPKRTTLLDRGSQTRNNEIFQFFSTGTGSPNLPVPVFSGIAEYRPVPVPIRVPAHPYREYVIWHYSPTGHMCHASVCKVCKPVLAIFRATEYIVQHISESCAWYKFIGPIILTR